jgi:hypothetical protein
MRTTLNLDDALLKTAKQHAAKEGKTLTRVFEEALRQYLQPVPSQEETFRLKLLTRKGKPIPGVDLADRDSLYDRMEGRK